MDSTYLANSNSSIYDLELLNNRWQLFIIIWYTLTAFISLLSNILTIIILIRCNQRFMSEIWKYLINLSISDILMSIFSIPFTYTSFMFGQWIFSTWSCPLIYSCQLLSVYVSIYTLTLIGFDRYFAIIYPFNKWLIFIKNNRLLIIMIIWLTGILISMIQLMKTRAISFVYRNELLFDCQELWNQQQGRLYTIFIFIITFGLPILILIYVYTSIGLYLWFNHRIPGNPDLKRDQLKWRQKVKITKMLVMIVLVFIICWLPLHVFSFIVWFNQITFKTYSNYLLYVISFFICHWLAMSHSFLNPFIYGFMSGNFKNNLYRLFCFECGEHNRLNCKLRQPSTKNGKELIVSSQQQQRQQPYMNKNKFLNILTDKNNKNNDNLEIQLDNFNSSNQTTATTKSTTLITIINNMNNNNNNNTTTITTNESISISASTSSSLNV